MVKLSAFTPFKISIGYGNATLFRKNEASYSRETVASYIRYGGIKLTYSANGAHHEF